jgi:hypothetical protein
MRLLGNPYRIRRAHLGRLFRLGRRGRSYVDATTNISTDNTINSSTGATTLLSTTNSTRSARSAHRSNRNGAFEFRWNVLNSHRSRAGSLASVLYLGASHGGNHKILEHQASIVGTVPTFNVGPTIWRHGPGHFCPRLDISEQQSRPG